MEIVLNGIKFGVVLAFLVGPVFFTIIQTSVERGFWKGVLMAMGVSFSDTLYVIICYFGVVQFISQPSFKEPMAYGGGAILIVFGLYHAIIKSRVQNSTTEIQGAHIRRGYRYFLKGFVINGFSPMVPIFWIGTISVASVDLGYEKGFDFFLFFSAMLITVLMTDISKAYLADKLRNLVTGRFLRIMNLVVGVCLIIFGVRLIWVGTTSIL